MHALLGHPDLEDWRRRLGHVAVRAAAIDVLEAAREQATEGGGVPNLDELTTRTVAVLGQRVRPRFRRVINATGIVLHTGLGRAPLAPQAVEAIAATAGWYTNLELDMESGKRGSRAAQLAPTLRELTGAEAALVVNNNAAAVLLLLSALAAGREVIVSRGELVEIGGSFRIPEVMVQGGARLREVGTTNRTTAADYESAIGPETGLILKVHRSNFRQIGFVAEASLAELAAVAERHGLPLGFDLGSGSLRPLGGEPDVRKAITAGSDVVTFSGDKLLGGPQAGILCGRSRIIDACAAHPLMRALRVDKLTIAALEATLALYRGPEPERHIPALTMLGRDADFLRQAADTLRQALEEALVGAQVRLLRTVSRAGAGALPERDFRTWAVALRHPDISAQKLAARLRRGEVPVLVRVHREWVVLDPRTLLFGEIAMIPAQVAASCAAEPEA